MTIKIICALAIVMSCSFIGARLSNTLCIRVRTLSGMVGAIKKMESQILAVRMPVSEIYEDLSAEKGVVGEFFSRVKVGESWNKQLNLLPGITSEDKKIFLSLSETLGNFESERQIMQIKMAVESLVFALSQAKKEMAENSKVYRAMSFFTGVIIAVLII